MPVLGGGHPKATGPWPFFSGSGMLAPKRRRSESTRMSSSTGPNRIRLRIKSRSDNDPVPQRRLLWGDHWVKQELIREFERLGFEIVESGQDATLHLFGRPGGRPFAPHPQPGLALQPPRSGDARKPERLRPNLLRLPGFHPPPRRPGLPGRSPNGSVQFQDAAEGRRAAVRPYLPGQRPFQPVRRTRRGPGPYGPGLRFQGLGQPVGGTGSAG